MNEREKMMERGLQKTKKKKKPKKSISSFFYLSLP